MVGSATSRKDGAPCESVRIFVRSGGKTLKKTSLQSAFGDFGHVVEIDTKKAGVAIIGFSESRDAKDAIRTMDGQIIDGCTVRVSGANERDPDLSKGWPKLPLHPEPKYADYDRAANYERRRSRSPRAPPPPPPPQRRRDDDDQHDTDRHERSASPPARAPPQRACDERKPLRDDVRYGERSPRRDAAERYYDDDRRRPPPPRRGDDDDRGDSRARRDDRGMVSRPPSRREYSNERHDDRYPRRDDDWYDRDERRPPRHDNDRYDDRYDNRDERLPPRRGDRYDDRKRDAPNGNTRNYP